MKKFINDYWFLIAVAVFLWWRKTNGKPTPGAPSGAPSGDEGGTKSINNPEKPKLDSVVRNTAESGKTSGTNETPTQSGTFTNTPTPPATHVCNAGTGTDIYQEAAKERAKYNTCPTHGSTMRHIHEYKAGHVTDYYECTVCGHRNIVYTK